MIEEPFATGNSLIHRIDPRFRVAVATALSFVIALSDQFPALGAGVMLSLVLALMARLTPWAVIRRLAMMWGFLLLLWLVLPLTFEGETLYHIGPVTLTRPGVLLAARITLKSNAILLVFIALIATMNFPTLGHALNAFRLPEKLVHLLLLTYRYIFVIEQEYGRLVRAARLRNFRPGTNLHTYKTYAYLVGILFVRASARADRVYQAMKCRGFRGKFYCLQEFAISRRDRIWGGFMFAGITGLLFLEWAGIKGWLLIAG